MSCKCNTKRKKELWHKYVYGKLSRGETHELFLRLRKCRRKRWLAELEQILQEKA